MNDVVRELERYGAGGGVGLDAEVDAGLEAEMAQFREYLAGGRRLPLAEPVVDEAAARQAAAKAVADLIDDRMIDAMVAQARSGELRLTGPGRVPQRDDQGGAQPRFAGGNVGAFGL